jgi:2-oxoglutarate ferredoxin oxidoreductase subunit gamma
MRVRFAGFGGQGIVLAAQLLGHGAILDGKNAMQTSSYGSAARGGNCAGDVAIDSGEIFEILPERFDVLVVMSQPALQQYLPALRDGGVLIYEADLVHPEGKNKFRCLGYPATKQAQEQFGNKIFANILMLGFTAGAVEPVETTALEQAIAANIKSRFVEKNLSAFALGCAAGKQAAR